MLLPYSLLDGSRDEGHSYHLWYELTDIHRAHSVPLYCTAGARAHATSIRFDSLLSKYNVIVTLERSRDPNVRIRSRFMMW